MLNYAVITLIQIELGELVLNESTSEITELSPDQANKLYDQHTSQAKKLMENKNHDYDEAWRDMQISSITDLDFHDHDLL